MERAQRWEKEQVGLHFCCKVIAVPYRHKSAKQGNGVSLLAPGVRIGDCRDGRSTLSLSVGSRWQED